MTAMTLPTITILIRLTGISRNSRHFLKEAHRRNLKVITELVINHTSDGA